MKLLTLKLTLLLFLSFVGKVYSAEDEFVRLTDKVTVTKATDNWLKATVSFALVKHPKLETAQRSRPATVEALSVEYLDNESEALPLLQQRIQEKVD